jgi:TonB-dependent SusC/RagA subfamily outer membrane receptor
MQFLFQFLLKISVSLAMVYLFYRLVLRPLTFYSWNRWYLLAYSAISFVIPFVDINPFLSDTAIVNSEMVALIPTIDATALRDKGWFDYSNQSHWFFAVFISGALVMMIRLLIQLFAYRRLKLSSRLLSTEPVKLYEVDKSIVPFSFGNAIFINSAQHADAELQDIIKHEFVHVRQKHTMDMMWAEVLCIVNWYNPFAWLIKKVIRQNLEFIADQQVLNNGLDKKEYQYLLLKVAGGAAYRITNQFNFSFLKKRIAMMNKMKSAKLHLVKFLFVLPLIAVLLLSFRGKIENLLIEVNDEKLSGPVSANAGLHLVTDTVPNQRSRDDSVHVRVREISVLADTTIHLSLKQKKDHPLYIVDEIITPVVKVRAIDPTTINRMEVLKGEHAEQYGEKGKNGVIRIYLKKEITVSAETDQRIKLRLSVSENNQVRLFNTRDSIIMEADSIIINDHQSRFYSKDSLMMNAKHKGQSEPLYIIDGVKQEPGADLSDLNQNTIRRIDVLKGTSATTLYGPEAKNGVLLITTSQEIEINPKRQTINRTIEAMPQREVQSRGGGRRAKR